jgi:hypothetical protein
MPDLSGLLAPRLMAGVKLHFFTGPRGANEREVDYRKNLARLIDKAVREYQRAREFSGTAESRVDPAILFCDHMENCLNAVHRAIRLLERIKGEGNIAQGLDDVAKKQVAAASRMIRRLRDQFEHVDDAIRCDRLPKDGFIMIALRGEDLIILTERLRLTDLVAALRQLRELGRRLVEH